MAYCRNCGNEMGPGANVCSMCGAQQQPPKVISQDKGGFGWGLLGCCIPLAGLILFLIWKDEKPASSKAAGIGALVGVGVSVLFYILYFVFIGVMVGLGEYGF